VTRPGWLGQLRWRAAHWGWEAAQRAGAVTADTPAGRRFAAFGRGSMAAFPPGSVFGEDSIVVGAGTLIGAFVTMSAGMVPGQDLGPQPVLRIGDRCVIGRGSHIVAHQSLVIEDDVFTGPYVYITDQNHGYADPDVPIGRQLPRNAPVRIGSGSWLGAGAVVLPGACIGRNVVIAAGSVVRGTVPDQCVAAGVPARVVRRYQPDAGWSASPIPNHPAVPNHPVVPAVPDHPAVPDYPVVPDYLTVSDHPVVPDYLAAPYRPAVALRASVAERVDGVPQSPDPLR
jgi:acetyltransferase-like isoleucine patch superfamily enzyme